jgi:hypothetical protein
MSGLENLKIDDIGTTFLDIETFENEQANGIEF